VLSISFGHGFPWGDSPDLGARLLVVTDGLGPFWDPVAVSFCHQAGVGATLKLRIGGKVSQYSGPPLDVKVEVVAVKKDAWQNGLSGTIAPLGDVAVVRIDGVKVVLTTHRTQGFGTNLFEQFGINLAETKLIVVKSSQHFHAHFGPIASEVVYVDTPGVAPANLRLLQYERAPRTLWPLNT
jgi:microcystin degradation protein MlrC